MATALLLLHAFWSTLAEMAPWLLFGFAAAGLLSVFVSAAKVKRHLGGSGPGPVVKAAVFGVPLPLCSCGVLPFAGGMYRQGASRGATSSFLLSTPQTGVDAFFATYALMGPVFAVVRPAVAFVHGLLGGLAVNAIAGARPADTDVAEEDQGGPAAAAAASRCTASGVREPGPAPAADRCGSASSEFEETRPDGLNSLFSQQKRESDPGGLACCDAGASGPKAAGISGNAPPSVPARLRTAARYAAVTLPGDLAGSLLVGVGVAAALMALVPPDALTPYLGGVVLSMGAAVVVGAPLYLCATGSIPIALGLMAAGASPGAALAFLIAGPATNAATLAVTWRMMGTRTGVTYLASVVLVAVAAGLGLDAAFTADTLRLPAAAAAHAHEHATPWWQHVSAAVLLVLLLRPAVEAVAARFGPRAGSAVTPPCPATP